MLDKDTFWLSGRATGEDNVQGVRWLTGRVAPVGRGGMRPILLRITDPHHCFGQKTGQVGLCRGRDDKPCTHVLANSLKPINRV